jgi:hypothetical protein
MPKHIAVAVHAQANHVAPEEPVQGAHCGGQEAIAAAAGGLRGFCFPLGQGVGIHSLQERIYSDLALSEGVSLRCGGEEYCKDKDLSLRCGEEEYCKDKDLCERIGKLHCLARSAGSREVQVRIDAYLAAAAWAGERAVAARLVLSLQDVPQEGTLPDLGNLIRAIMTQREGKQKRGLRLAYPCSMLQAALPCISTAAAKGQAKAKRGAAPAADAADGKQIGLCVLLGLLLGLYPSCVKFPTFRVRVHLFRRVHVLLTGGGGAEFCKRYHSLVALAFMEYACHILRSYMPVEYEILQTEQGMAAFFQTCSVQCDAFRQEMLQTGLEAWPALDDHCAQLVDKHMRTCKNKRAAVIKFAQADIIIAPAAVAGDLHYIVPYPVHLDDASNAIIVNEMAFLSTGADRAMLHQAASLHRLITVHALPRDIVDLQLRCIRRAAAICERSAVSTAVLYVCAQCAVSPDAQRRDYSKLARGQCRLDLSRNTLVCATCMGDSIARINTVAKVVSVKNCKFYYAPCCNKVQLYEARGDEFQCVFDHEKMDFVVRCPHASETVAPSSRRAEKRRCEICNAVALAEGHTTVDHLTAAIKTVFLCQRHTPSEDALRLVKNWRQLQAEIRKRDRPLMRAVQ